MSCTSCSSEDGGKPSGCNSNGGCSTGGCNKLNTFDWLAQMEIDEPAPFDAVEVSFKNGSRKGFYYNTPQARACLLYTSPSPRDATLSRMPSSA